MLPASFSAKSVTKLILFKIFFDFIIFFRKSPATLSSTIILIDILIMPMLKYYDLDYIYTTNDILLSIQFIIFVVMVWIEIYSASKIKKYKNLG